jgi:hypothetical protein
MLMVMDGGRMWWRLLYFGAVRSDPVPGHHDKAIQQYSDQQEREFRHLAVETVSCPLLPAAARCCPLVAVFCRTLVHVRCTPVIIWK